MTKPYVINNSGNNEWYTPLNILESTRLVMGSITTDPASNNLAQTNVKSEVFYDENSDGLTKSWFGNVWMNPLLVQANKSIYK